MSSNAWITFLDKRGIFFEITFMILNFYLYPINFFSDQAFGRRGPIWWAGPLQPQNRNDINRIKIDGAIAEKICCKLYWWNIHTKKPMDPPDNLILLKKQSIRVNNLFESKWRPTLVCLHHLCVFKSSAISPIFPPLLFV